jgi:hypothetical protein
MTRAFHAFEGDDENPELATLRRAELLFIATEYPSLYLPGMVKALGLECDKGGRYWVPPTPEADEPASPFVADPENPTDAELAAAVERGLADGSIITAEQFLAQVADDAEIDRAHTVTHSNGITQVFAAPLGERGSEPSLGAYQREGASYRTYAPDASSLGVWGSEVSAYRAIVRSAQVAPKRAGRDDSDRCGVCHRDAHRPRTGYQGHPYTDPKSRKFSRTVNVPRSSTPEQQRRAQIHARVYVPGAIGRNMVTIVAKSRCGLAFIGDDGRERPVADILL